MNFLPRFSRLMAEALHCAGAPEGLALPLHEVRERLHALADEERSRPLPSSAEALPAPLSATLPLPDATGEVDDAARHIRLACDNARFAVYAWVDELLLQSPRLDAADWLSHSLQYRYCGTTSAGREFFTRLTGIIRNALPLTENAPTAASEEEEPADEVLRALEAFVLHGGDELSTAAVSVYALCLLAVCLCCFFQFVIIAMKMRAMFYKLIAFGLGTVYITQVFLTVGGAVKFIPSTGVTLPFVSYGGSSLLASFALFNIIQGLYILKREEEADEKG